MAYLYYQELDIEFQNKPKNLMQNHISQIFIIEYFISTSLLSQQHAYMDPARLVLAGLGVYILLVF